MPMRSIIGLDHVVIVTKDLAGARRRWEELGFTVAPLGMHTAVMGTANHTIMLGPDYIELIGIVAPTERNLQSRQLLERRGDGIERAAFTGTDADDGVAELKARGFAALGPFDFGRPVELPDGRQVEARFRTFLWPVDERPGGLRVFACQHLTREHVWLPELTRHANSATRIDRIEMLSPDPAKAAAHMSRLIDRPVEVEADGARRVETGSSRGAFVFVDRAQLERRHAGVPLGDLPAEAGMTIAVKVADLAAARRVLAGRAAISDARAVKVAPAEANGVVLELSAE